MKGDSEITYAKQMLESFMPYMSGLVVAITGLNEPRKQLTQLIHKYKGHVISVQPDTHPQVYGKDDKGYFFADFAAARNVTFDYADTQEGYDWYTWADVDDVLVEGEKLQEIAEIAKKSKYDRVFFTYWYALKVRPDNTFDENCVMIEHDRERLIRPKIFKWISRLHEVTVPKDQDFKPVDAPYRYDPKENQFTVWAHLTNMARAKGAMDRNIKILELQAKEEEHKDPRTLFYLAKTYHDMEKKEYDDLAYFLLEEYRKTSGWNAERANSWEYTAKIMCRRGQHQAAIDALHQALREYPDRHMFFLLLAKEYNELGHHEFSEFWLDVAVKMDAPQSQTTIGNPLEIKFMAAALKAQHAIRKTQLDEAIHWIEVRNELGGIKDDPVLKSLLEAKALNEAGKQVFNYAKWLKDNKHLKYLELFLQSLPPEIGQEPFVAYIANEIREPKVWAKNSIVYFANFGGTFFEKFSGKTVEAGQGGSETAVYELTKRWVEAGYDVTVYGDPREDAGDYHGVHWRPWYEINWKDTFNIFIGWRAVGLLDRDIKAKKIYLDLHDVTSNLEFTPERIAKVDKVFFKSKFHRSMCPALPDEKVEVISNGINV